MGSLSLRLSRITVGNAKLCFAVLSAVALMLSAEDAVAQNSLGIGRPEQVIEPEGFFAGFLFWVQEQQRAFYRLMTDALKLIRNGESGFWWLAGLSFAYGVLHAAGPGHGKAVISSYMLANETQLRRGVLLSFGSAMLQATVAVIAITALVLVLRGLGLKQGTLTFYLEIASYAAVTGLGLWLFVRKLMMVFQAKTPQSIQEHACNGHHESADHDQDSAHEYGVCPSCGHVHMPSPDLIGDRDFGAREAWSAILAVGLRPCSGALIVLTFAFLNGLYAAGIASAYAMAIGTGITVAIIATVAVMAKNTAFRVLGITSAGAVYYNAVELIGAGLILMIGFTLLMASLA